MGGGGCWKWAQENWGMDGMGLMNWIDEIDGIDELIEGEVNVVGWRFVRPYHRQSRLRRTLI